jgi:hypothetical protein
MSALTPQDERAYFWRRPWVQVLNSSSSEPILPYSVVLITSASLTTNGDAQYTVRQPNAASTDFNWNGYLITGPWKIGIGGRGIATNLAEPGLVRYDSSGTPAIKDVWGPKHGQWTLSKNYCGFEIVGGNTTASGNAVTLARWIGVNEVLIVNGSGGDYAADSGPSTYKVYGGTAGSEADTGMTLSCYNKTSISFKNGKYGSAGRLNGGQVYAVPWKT